MSDQSSYEKLGVSESASFEEIQEARNRLVDEYSGDRKSIEVIEAAYDAVLMERLRLRQEGKIKVPDRIRFPEKLVQPTPSPAVEVPRQSPAWLQRLIDTPTWPDILWPGGLLFLLGTGVILYPTAATLQLAMTLAVALSLYFLYRKERKLGRAVLLSLLGLIGSFVVGTLLEGFLRLPVANLQVPGVFVSLVTFLVLWLVSSFLK